MIQTEKSSAESILSRAPLGKLSKYTDIYDNRLLFAIPRKSKRDELGISVPLPFMGQDLWTAYELSWLNAKGKPVVAVADFVIPCESPFLIESKSFKLYLNSFTNTVFADCNKVKSILMDDLAHTTGGYVKVELYFAEDFKNYKLGQMQGFCLDTLDISGFEYEVNATLLETRDKDIKNQSLYSHLLKSNCLITGQPDWGSVSITYSGPCIDEAALLRYLVSFRNHNEFHEQCVERIFMDILTYCKPVELTVFARYTRRGGLDINPFRSTVLQEPKNNIRLYRQ